MGGVLIIQANGTPRALLAALAAHGRPMEQVLARALARALAGGSHAGDVALLRCVEKGWLKVECRLTEAGARALQLANRQRGANKK